MFVLRLVAQVEEDGATVGGETVLSMVRDAIMSMVSDMFRRTDTRPRRRKRRAALTPEAQRSRAVT